MLIPINYLTSRTMNTNTKLSAFFKRFTSKDCEENDYTPILKVAKTIYPDGKKNMSLNGMEEWYGTQEGKQLTTIT